MSQSDVIVLLQALVKSPAWLDLNGAAIKAYCIFRVKCQVRQRPGKPGKKNEKIIVNNGQLQFTYREAKTKYGFTASRYRRALDDLIGHGFLDVAATGMGVHKVVTLYAISERWRAWGTADFVGAKRPKPPIANPGFKRGNKLAKNRHKKKESSVENEHGAVCEIEHGEVLTVCEIEHGEDVAELAQTHDFAEVRS